MTEVVNVSRRTFLGQVFSAGAFIIAAPLVPSQCRVLHDQLERAALSAILNLAEGAGRHSRKDKRRLYTIARGSAMEVAACIDVLRVRRLGPEGACRTARALALRLVQVVTKLCAALS